MARSVIHVMGGMVGRINALSLQIKDLYNQLGASTTKAYPLVSIVYA